MSKTTALVSLLGFVILSSISLASARPAISQALSRQKRQSDQRLAELETLLALQKYGRHRFRMDHKKGVGADGEPGYGIIDFRMLGRKKKSTRFSPGELENSVKVKQISISDADDRPTNNFQENQQNPYWTSDASNISNENEDKDSITFSKHPPSQKLGQQRESTDRIVDLNQPEVVPLFYLQNK